MKVLVTGAAGFIGGYVCRELVARGHDVLGADNFSRNPRPDNPPYGMVWADCRDAGRVLTLLEGVDHFIAGAARVGGISYFHKYPFDLLAGNERITEASCSAAIRARDMGSLRKVTWISSSMVYERARTGQQPSAEGDELTMPPPLSSYGFQKLAVEYFARAAWDQYQLPYTIVRPFNCAGPGEAPGDAHVLPDLVRKIRGGQDPVELYGDGSQVRHFTHGTDVARGICDAMEHPDAANEDFNIASDEGTTVLELARMVWERLRGPAEPFRYVCVPGFAHDVQRRVPSTEKAARVLGFKASVSLSQIVDEVIKCSL